MTDGEAVAALSKSDRVLEPREEIAEFIATQEGRIGDVYRLSLEGLDPAQIAARLNVETAGFVYSYRANIDAALDGRIANGPTLLKQTRSALNGLISKGRAQLSVEALDLLASHRNLVNQALADLDPVMEAQADAEAKRAEVLQVESLKGLAGIYAFSYGWYIEKPVGDDEINTLIKVGRSIDVAARINEHRRGARAHIPEPLVSLRVYATDQLKLSDVERTFHRLLSTAGHVNPRRETQESRRQNEVGREWFLTNVDFLDEIASTLHLRTVYQA
ncbi:GIY-YIG nuclease family protein [Rhodococcoides kroppenstedtii]|uniref:GIY-YIG nuclease family protein n=1 Tax=Rhodococcoides kroppenstedtii TaxID=293050 RepID=UPI001427ED9C|nr:GIY-YIG nuclease family protein [Rhodococcus kroppenstedtii]NIL81098.1 hypothetical protein [Rhodococcus kroppenstedtii]